MLRTGTVVSPECLSTYEALKMKQEYGYIICSIKNNTIVVEKTGQKSESLEELVDSLPDNDCRYGICNLSFEVPGREGGFSEGRRTKTLFISWNPETASTRNKFTYSACCFPLKEKLSAINLDIQASDKSELSRQELTKKCLGKRS